MNVNAVSAAFEKIGPDFFFYSNLNYYYDSQMKCRLMPGGDVFQMLVEVILQINNRNNRERNWIYYLLQSGE